MKKFLPLDVPVTVSDYPYGFNLRTSITYWVERKPGKGMRSVSQTVNPKTGKPNKPKYSTYSAFVRLYEDTETSHIHAFHYNPYDAKGYDEALSCGAFEGVPDSYYPHEKIERYRIRTSIRETCTAQYLFEGQAPIELPTLSPTELEIFANSTSIPALRELERIKREERDANEAARPAHIF